MPHVRTTDGAIAVANLDGEIESLESARRDGRLSRERQRALVELLSLRGQFLGRIRDYERSLELARDLVREDPGDPDALLATAFPSTWRPRATSAKPKPPSGTRRFEALLATHPEAFADNTAELWLAAGADPEGAVALARSNTSLRRTWSWLRLLAQSALAAGQAEEACCGA